MTETVLLSLALSLSCPGGGPQEGDDPLGQVRKLEEERVRLIEKIAPSVVALFKAQGSGGGSGVIFDSAGYVLTNYHVVGTAKEMRAGMPGGRILRGKVIGVDPRSDLALVRLLGVGPFPYSPIGDSDALSIGDFTLAMGNPFLLATDFRPTVTMGIVSGLHRFQPGGQALVYHDCVQVDTPINPGNSGGPLFDMNGKIVGINGRISGRRGRVNVGVGFAVSATQVREVLSDLRAGNLVRHGTMGATVRDQVDRDAPRGFRVVVDQMYDDSVAARAGVELGDEIVRFDETPVRSQNHFQNLLGILPAGRTVEITLRRRVKGEGRVEKTVRVILGALPLPKEIQRSHGTDDAHRAWETARILQRYKGQSRVDPGQVVAWESKRREPDGDEARVRSYRAGRLFRREIHKDGKPFRMITIDEEGARYRSGDDPWVPLAEDIASDLRAEILSLGTLAYGDPGRFRSATFVGGDKVQGRLVDVIRVEVGEETPVDLLFDTESGLLSGCRYATKLSGGGRVIVVYSDYRETDGRLLPYRITRGMVRGPKVLDSIERYLPEEAIPEEYRKARPPGREF